MRSGHSFNPRTRKTLDELQDLLRDHAAVAPMLLASRLYPEEAAILNEIEAFLLSLPDKLETLQPADVQTLRPLAEKLEDGHRRGRPLKILAQKITAAPDKDFRLQKAHAARLRDLLEQALVQDVQTRVHELRQAFAKLGAAADGTRLTVSRSPYRLLHANWTLCDEDAVAIEALYPMFDRQAWKGPPSYLETKAFRLAQDRLRFALATGMILADDGTPLPQQGTPKCSLGTAVREQLDWVVEVSNMMQQVFEIFYAPCPAGCERDRFYVLASWAEPHTVAIVQFILACRNEILRVMNGFFASVGKKPWPFVHGHDFPPRLLAGAAIPDAPLLVPSAELASMHRRLREIGIDHFSQAA